MHYLQLFDEWVAKYALFLMFCLAFSGYVSALHTYAFTKPDEKRSFFARWLMRTLCIFIATAGFAFLMSSWSNLPS